MIQLELPYEGARVNVHKLQDHKYEAISYIGEAVQQLDGTWRCLANVDGMLCIVQIKITVSNA